MKSWQFDLVKLETQNETKTTRKINAIMLNIEKSTKTGRRGYSNT